MVGRDLTGERHPPRSGPPPVPDVRRVRLQNPLRTLRHRDFRLLWTGELTRTSAQGMDHITRGFLVLDLTGSGAQLALVSAARGLPLLLLGVLSGLLADRVSRKRLLLASQSVNTVTNVALGILVLTGQVRMWHVYVSAVVMGFGMALNAPARQSALPSLVPGRDLQSAVVLNTATLNIGMAVGPVAGGLLVGTMGIGGAYVVQASLFAVAGALIRRIHLPFLAATSPQPWGESARDGVRYIREHELLPSLLLMSLVPILLVQPFRSVIPAIATQQLGLGPGRTGVLVAAVGAGAVLSVIALASLPPIARPGRIVVVAGVGFGISTAVFAASRSFLLAVAVLFVGGLLQANMRTLTQSLLLTDTEDAFRGRISSAYVVNRGMMPIGATLLGGLATVASLSAAIVGMSLLGATMAALIGWRARALWRR